MGAEIKDHAENVAVSYDVFRGFYSRFRRKAGLPPARKDAYEMTTALADKLGRLCRIVKHLERKDPLKNSTAMMEECVAGMVVYLEMLAQRYKLDLMSGFARELMKAVVQHGNK